MAGESGRKESQAEAEEEDEDHEIGMHNSIHKDADLEESYDDDDEEESYDDIHTHEESSLNSSLNDVLSTASAISSRYKTPITIKASSKKPGNITIEVDHEDKEFGSQLFRELLEFQKDQQQGGHHDHNSHQHHHHQQPQQQQQMKAIQQEIKIAFIGTATNMIGVLFLFLLYFNWIMWRPYLTPIFWSLIFAITFWEAKNNCVKYLESLKLNEFKSKSWFKIDGYWKKIKTVLGEALRPKKESVLMLMAVMLICFFLSYHIIRWLPWFVHVFVLPLLLLSLLGALIIFANPSTYHTLVALLFVLCLVFGMSFVVVFFASKCVEESVSFLRRTAGVFEVLMKDEVMEWR